MYKSDRASQTQDLVNQNNLLKYTLTETEEECTKLTLVFTRWGPRPECRCEHMPQLNPEAIWDF